MSSANPTLWSDARLLMDVMPVGVFRIDLENKHAFIFANDCLSRILTYTIAEIQSLCCDAVFPDKTILRALIDKAIKDGSAFCPEIAVLTKTKRSLSCSLSLVAVKEDKSKVRFIDGILQDISDIKRVERDFKESKELFQTVFNSSAVAIIVADEFGKITAWNPFVQEMLEMEKIDIFNKDACELYPPNEWDRMLALRSKETGMITDIETQVYKKGGIALDVALSLSFIRDSEQKVIGTIAILRDMTKQKIAERKIRESENKIRIILDHSAAAITLTDEQERIISWNRFTEQMLGKTKDDLYLQHISSLYPEDEWKKIRAEGIRKTGSRHHFETRAAKKDGTIIDVDLSVNVLKDSNDNIVGSVGIMQDITEQKKVQQMLVKAKIAAEEANNSKSLFLANMSHEVRTPMNTILGLVDLTLDTQGLTAEQRDNLSTIKNAGDILLSLLNDILDLSRVEAGKIQLENIELSLSNIVQSVCKGLEVLSRQKKLELVREVDPSIPEVLIGDPVRIRQILVNLINNAIKFTFQGQITTRVKLVNIVDGICELQFSVKDQGVGIPKDKVETIFEAFTQADASTTRRFGGTGLGLAISKRLVEMMGGRIWAESEEFQGSTFIFTAKFRVAENVKAVAVEVVEAAPVIKETRNLRVLLAEDNVVNQKIAAKMLEKKGWFVKGAENGKQVLEYLEQEQFDVILMDAQMPVLDGFEATRLIREAEQKTGKHIPIVALTAHAMAGDRQKCLDAGMDGYVSKPIDRQKLYEAVESVVT